MNIYLKKTCGFTLIIEDENFKLSEDVESRVYEKSEQGRVFTIRDIKTEALEQFCDVLSDLICNRVGNFDSSYLIERLFDKLPKDIAESLSKKLNHEYN